MKKSLIALAVAGVVAAPAFAATGNVDVYGKVRIALSNTDSSDWTLSDQVSRIGFKGSEDLGGGLKALWQMESGVSAAGAAANVNMGRNTFLGLAGGFGTVIVGRHDTPYKLAGSADLFGDTVADSQHPTAGIIGANNFDLRVNTAIAYITPDFNGFHAAVATVVAGGELNAATSLAGIYKNGPLNASIAYEDHAVESGLAEDDAFKVNVGYAMGDLKLGATFEDQDIGGTNWLVSAAYGMGPITLAAQYGDREAGDVQRAVIGAIYGLSKRTNVAVAYMDQSSDTAALEDNGFTLQLNHDF